MAESTISRRTYTLVFIALLILLVLSAWVAQYDLGRWNTIVAFAISAAKMILIVLFFMHVIHSTRIVQLFSAAGLLWLGIAAVLTFSDYLTRGWMTDALPEYHEAASDRVEALRPLEKGE